MLLTKLRNISLWSELMLVINNIDFKKQVSNANAFYLDLIGHYKSSITESEHKINYLRHLANYCWNWHTGRFTSAFIENELKDISKFFPDSFGENIESDRMVLLSTELYETGGHTRLLENYADYLKKRGYKITLIITRQNVKESPLRIVSENKKLFDRIEYLGGTQIADAIKIIRQNVNTAFRVFNFQHPDDTLLVAALNSNTRPYTYYINHADHIFWLGISSSDALINLRPYSNLVTSERRSVNLNTFILPVRLNTQQKYLSKSSSRKILSISDDDIVITLVSAIWKIFPDRNYNLFEIIEKVLAFNAKVRFILVGVTGADYERFSGGKVPARVECVGVQPDTSVYLSVADYYMEGMPSNSLTALMDAIYAGCYPFLIWGPYHPNMQMDSELYVNNEVKHPADKRIYLDKIQVSLENLENPEYKLAVGHMQENIKYYCSDAYWDSLMHFNESNWTRTDSLAPIEFENTLYDQRLAEQAGLLWKMNHRNPYFNTLENLYNNGLISRKNYLKLWFKSGIKGTHSVVEKINFSWKSILRILPHPIDVVKTYYASVNDNNVIKKYYKTVKIAIKK